MMSGAPGIHRGPERPLRPGAKYGRDYLVRPRPSRGGGGPLARYRPHPRRRRRRLHPTDDIARRAGAGPLLPGAHLPERSGSGGMPGHRRQCQSHRPADCRIGAGGRPGEPGGRLHPPGRRAQRDPRPSLHPPPSPYPLPLQQPLSGLRRRRDGGMVRLGPGGPLSLRQSRPLPPLRSRPGGPNRRGGHHRGPPPGPTGVRLLLRPGPDRAPPEPPPRPRGGTGGPLHPPQPLRPGGHPDPAGGTGTGTAGARSAAGGAPGDHGPRQQPGPHGEERPARASSVRPPASWSGTSGACWKRLSRGHRDGPRSRSDGRPA